MEKDTNNPQVTQKDNKLFEALSLVFKDSKGIYLYKKSEKISKAFFLMTQHLEDTQSIKIRMRDTALALLDRSQVFLTLSRLDEESSKEVVLNMMTLISLSDIGLGSKFISDANHQIIIKQIQIFINEIAEYVDSINKDNSLIPSTLFDVNFIDSASSISSSKIEESILVTKEIAKGHPHKEPSVASMKAINTQVNIDNKVPEFTKDTSSLCIVFSLQPLITSVRSFIESSPL
jgi:hypothetical protein